MQCQQTPTRPDDSSLLRGERRSGWLVRFVALKDASGTVSRRSLLWKDRDFSKTFTPVTSLPHHLRCCAKRTYHDVDILNRLDSHGDVIELDAVAAVSSIHGVDLTSEQHDVTLLTQFSCNKFSSNTAIRLYLQVKHSEWSVAYLWPWCRSEVVAVFRLASLSGQGHGRRLFVATFESCRASTRDLRAPARRRRTSTCRMRNKYSKT